MIPETPHIICDHLRLADLLRMDTAAGGKPPVAPGTEG